MLANATTLETPGNEPSSLNILFFGDSGTGSLDQWHVAQGMQKYCKKAHCDFGLLLGDNIYQKGATSVDDQQFQTKFEKPYKNLGLEFYVALGNHDTYSGQKGTRTQIAYTQKSQIWNMPARYYQFSQGNADFFAIDSNTFHLDQRQRTWLTSALARSTASWKIVYAHHPVYSTGSHGFFDLLEGGRMRRLRQKLTPILCKYGVDLYLTGHDHHLELNQSQCGVVHVISGASAKARRAYASLKKRWSTINKYARGYKLGFASLQLFSQSAVVRLLDAQGEELFSYPFKKRSFTTAP